MSESPAPTPSPEAVPGPIDKPQGNQALVLFLVLAVTAAGGWFVFTQVRKSREKAEDERLVEARQLLKDGKHAAAAQLCRAVGEENPDAKAPVELYRDILKEVGLAQAERVIAEAYLWKSLPDLQRDARKRGLQLLREKGLETPVEAMALLRFLPQLLFELDERAEYRELRREIYTAGYKKNPQDPDRAADFAQLKKESHDVKGALEVLEPIKEKLGMREGALLLAEAYQFLGKLDQAVETLLPFETEGLPMVRPAELKYRQLVEAIEKRVFAEIDSGTSKDFDFVQYRAANADEKLRLKYGYLQLLVTNDEHVQKANEERFRHRLSAHGLAEFSQLLVQRARRTLSAPQADKDLLRAEMIVEILVGSVVDQPPQMQTRLIALAYQRGKPDVGKQRVDALMKKFNDALPVAQAVEEIYSSLGEVSAARAFLEHLYEKDKPREYRQALAFGRARIGRNAEDEIVWLNKADQEHTETQLALLQAQSRQAEEQDKSEEAATLVRTSLDQIDKLDDSGMRHSLKAHAHLSLFRIKGERADLEKGIEQFEKRMERERNAAHALVDAMDAVYLASCHDVARKKVDPAVLRLRSGIAAFPLFLRDRAGRGELEQQLRDHVGIKKVRVWAEELLKQQPNHMRAREVLATCQVWSRDVAGLADQEKKTRDILFYTDQNVQSLVEMMTARYGTQRREEFQAARARWEKLEAERKKTPDRAYALAASGLAMNLLQGARLGESIDLDRPLKLAEQAHQLAPSRATQEGLIAILLHRVERQLRERDAEYRTQTEGFVRVLDPMHLIGLALSHKGPVREMAIANPDFKRAIELVKQRFKDFPDEPSPSWHVLVSALDAEEGKKIADALKADTFGKTARQLTLRLNPAYLAQVIEEQWQLQLEGKQKEAEELLQRTAELGVPLPFPKQ